jgi:hypothetical protein
MIILRRFMSVMPFDVVGPLSYKSNDIKMGRDFPGFLVTAKRPAWACSIRTINRDAVSE